jgi:TrmH family RNA methyltransferase
MIFVALVEPETSGNVGAVARSMKNFGLKNLLLINPKCNHLDDEAINRSVHAKEVLKNAKVLKCLGDLRKFDYVVASTAISGSDYNLPRSALSPVDLSDKISNSKNRFVLVFGREGDGLSNLEIRFCDVVVTIPSSPVYPTLNLSHAATILFYELFKNHNSNKSFVLASETDKSKLFDLIDSSIVSLPFSSDDKKDTQKILWKRILNKSFLTKREIFGLFGFFKKLKK